MAKRTYMALVLDKSGSMQSVRLATVSTYNEQVEQMKIDARDGEDILASLVTFNRNTYEHLWNVPASEMPLASFEGYDPEGGTNIWDAMGYVIDRWEKDTNTSDPDNYYVMTVISDGQHEDPQCKRKPKQLHSEITERQKTGRWTFSFMGCDKHYLEECAKTIGIPVSNTGTWSNANNMVAAATAGANVKLATSKYFAERKLGKNVAANFFNDDDAAKDFVAEAAAAGLLTPNPLVPSGVSNVNMVPDGHTISNQVGCGPVVATHFGPTHSQRSRLLGGTSHMISPQSFSFGAANLNCGGVPSVDELAAYKLNTTPDRNLVNVFGTSRKV